MEPLGEEIQELNDTTSVRARYFLPLGYLTTNIFIFVEQ